MYASCIGLERLSLCKQLFCRDGGQFVHTARDEDGRVVLCYGASGQGMISHQAAKLSDVCAKHDG